MSRPGGVVWITHGTADPIPRVQIPARAFIISVIIMLNANTYVTSQKGIGGSIRNQYEDFYVEEIPEIIECHYTLGPYTMLIKLYAKNDEYLMELLNGKIQEIKGVVSTETLTCLDQRIKRQVPVNSK